MSIPTLKQKSFEIEEIQGFDFTWPYITFRGLNNFQFIFNANQRHVIHRVELPEDIIDVRKSVITELLELYLVVETKNDFKFLKCDLDVYED